MYLRVYRKITVLCCTALHCTALHCTVLYEYCTELVVVVRRGGGELKNGRILRVHGYALCRLRVLYES